MQKEHPLNGNQYAPLPYSLLKELSPNEVIIYSVMLDRYHYSLKRWGAFNQGNKKLLDATQIPERTLIRSLAKLEELGYIVAISKKRGCPTIWHVNNLQENSHLPLQSEPIITERIKSILGEDAKVADTSVHKDLVPEQTIESIEQRASAIPTSHTQPYAPSRATGSYDFMAEFDKAPF